MQVQAKDLYDRFRSARSAMGKPASTDLFDLMIKQAMQQGGARQRQYGAFLDKLRQAVSQQYKTGRDRRYSYKNKRMDVDKRGPKGGREGGIKVGKEGRNAQSDEDKQRVKNLKRNSRD